MVFVNSSNAKKPLYTETFKSPKLKNKIYFDDSVYDSKYPAGSLPFRLHGVPKIQRI